MIGQTISHYRIIEKLGGGGMGVVYKAEDIKLHRFVALKLLPDDVAKEPPGSSPFSMLSASRVGADHPNICTIYDGRRARRSPTCFSGRLSSRIGRVGNRGR